MKKMTKEEFIERAKQVHGDKYNYLKVEYINSKTKVCIICPIHGEFWQSPRNHLKYGCLKCGNSKRYTTDSFIQKAREIHGDKYDYSRAIYEGALNKICIICPIHGEFWQTASKHLIGTGCPKCRGKNMNTEEFIRRANEVHGHKYNYSKAEYVNNVTKVCIICPIHGEFWQAPRHHLNGTQCPKCKESRLEKEIRSFLEEHHIEYINECDKKTFKWLGRQRLDFYLPKYNVAIECQGEEHFKGTNFGSKTVSSNEAYKDVIRRDIKKKLLCKENNVKLLYYSNLGIIYPYNVFENKNFLLNAIKNE